jgi:hypothetical protein
MAAKRRSIDFFRSLLEFAHDYPTIGPTGKLNADINGTAVSIESFLGREALTGCGKSPASAFLIQYIVPLAPTISYILLSLAAQPTFSAAC